MIHTATGLALVLLAGTASHGYEAVLDEAGAQFADGKYHDGRWILVEAARDETLPATARARIMNRLARYYEEDAGDFREAERVSRMVGRLSLPAGDPEAEEARSRLARLRTYAEDFRAEDEVLKNP